MAVRDDIGRRGEYIFEVLITRFCGRARPYFRPFYLGEKAEVVDYLVVPVGCAGVTPFFFAQVRATRRGYDGRQGRLRVGVSAEQVRRRAAFPAPAYVVGIDAEAEVGYIVNVNRDRIVGLSGLPTHSPLECGSLRRLWDEVCSYWAARGKPRFESSFPILLDQGG